MMNGKLYELKGNMAQLHDMLRDAESNSEMVAMIQDTIEATEESIGEEIEGLIAMQREFEGNAEMLKREEKMFAERKKHFEEKAAGVKAFVEMLMKDVGCDHKNKKSIETKFGKLAFQKNPARLVVTDETKIPMQYEIIQNPKYDMKALMNDIKDKTKAKEMQPKIVRGKEVMKEVVVDVDVVDLTETHGVKIINDESHLRIR